MTRNVAGVLEQAWNQRNVDNYWDFAADRDKIWSIASSVGSPVKFSPLMKNAGVAFTPSCWLAVNRLCAIWSSSFLSLMQAANWLLLMPPSLASFSSTAR